MNSFGDILTRYRKAAGLTQIEVARELTRRGYKINSGAICTWEKGTACPDAKQFLTLCEVLGIHDIYNDFIGYNPEDPFARLNDDGKLFALKTIHLLEQSSEYTRSENRTTARSRLLPFYDIPVSAGTGNFLDNESYEMIEVSPEVSSDAEYGIRVTGDSMEPRFVNGQIVWVQPVSDLSSGDIGIFFLDGNAYIKKLSKDKNGAYLVSLNPKYAPIPITGYSQFQILGKVVS